MRPRYILLLFACFVIHVAGRPQQAEYSNDSDVEEEEEDDSAGDAYSADDEDPRPNDQEPAVQEDVTRSRRLLDLAEGRYLQSNSPVEHKAPIKPDSVLDSREERSQEQQQETNFNEQLKLFPNRRQLNRYNDANDEQQEMRQHLTNKDVSKSSHVRTEAENQANKRTIEFDTTANEEEGDMIFTRNREQVSYINKNENSANDAPDSEQPRYIKQYYNTMQAEGKDMIDDKTHEGAHFKLRDRRDVKEANQPENSISPSSENKESNSKADSEDDESAIKRHIKKLSKNELDQLLSSLSEEKRELLKKIIDEIDPTDNGYINKREITKKAGAVEENSYLENYQSDLSKVQGGSPASEVKTEVSISQAAETETNKPESSPDSSETTQKVADLNLAALSSNNNDAIQKSSDSSLTSFSLNVDSKDQADTNNVRVTSKTENKREANLDDLEEVDDSLEDNNISGQDYSNDQGYFCSQDESNMEVENQPHEDKYYKREAFYDKESELSDSFRSLEESFPNSDTFEDAEPYSGPLVRVKRKTYDQVVKKRAIRLLPDAKVAYFPYKAENDDEDNEEGNEFDDEGFYDRTSNFVNSNKAMDDDAADKAENSVQAKSENADNSKSSNENVESDTRSLGSDTDSVLSGAEGVDDNLMYNSGIRNRRTAEENVNDATQTEDSSTAVMQDAAKSPSENFINVPHYQENDAFGPLPRSYDGDLTRYKRIRRVKQLHNAQGPSVNDT